MRTQGNTSPIDNIEQALLEELEEIFGNARDNTLFDHEDQNELIDRGENDTLRRRAGDEVLFSRSVPSFIKYKQAV